MTQHMTQQTMSMDNEIKRRIETALAPEALKIINESHKHAGHAGDNGTGQTHYKLEVVSKAFVGYTRIQRQRAVNKALNDLFDKGLHAISCSLKAPDEK
ncbi:MAG: BolA family protein [Bdellovibrionales bacterium]